MGLWFSADLHIGHKRMLEFRPFTSIEGMNIELINRFNSKVKDDDEVWILGDLSFANWTKTEEILKQLNGRKNLVYGNHDKHYRTKLIPFFESVQDYKELKYKDELLILSHYPFHKWNKGHWGSIHLHGHSHSSLPQEEMRRFDVGVDTPWANYAPISIETILAEAEKYPIAPYHH